MTETKENYICAVPFSSLEVHDHKRFLCCASWLLKYLPEDSSSKDAWFSKEADEVRDSMLDGSYRYCDNNQCPYLHQLETFGHNIGKANPLFHKDSLPPALEEQIKKYKTNKKIYPTIAQFSMDRSCNLACPSCRLDMFIADSKKIKKVKEDIEDIQTNFSKYIEVLYITGSGDPFISVGFRDFLRTLDSKKWPRLKKIHLHTNATKWNKEMWDSMKAIWPYVKTCEISIDAGTKDTYENKVRINGKWDELISNLKFIATIPELQTVKTSFVVQKHNYKEMKLFYDLMLEIFGKKASVYFGKINNWGTFSNEEFETHKVWNETHNEYSSFLKEVNRTIPAKQLWHNLQEFVEPKKSMI